MVLYKDNDIVLVHHVGWKYTFICSIIRNKFSIAFNSECIEFGIRTNRTYLAYPHDIKRKLI